MESSYEFPEFTINNVSKIKAFLLIFHFTSRQISTKKLEILLPDSYLQEVDFTLKTERIFITDFHHLDLLIENPLNLNDLHVEFNSLDLQHF